MRRLAPMALFVALALTPGCGGGGEGSRGSALVDPAVDPPINSLEADPRGDALLMTTNRGFFRIADGKADRISSTAMTPDGETPVGTFLAVAVDGDRLVGSGHPDNPGRIADFLGSMISTDGGETWRVSSRYGIADLHAIRPADGRLYAFDAVLDALLTSDDGARNWTEHGGPPERVIDFVVDPADPDQMLASTQKDIFHSTDGGERWSITVSARMARLAWPAPDRLIRADEDGLIYASDNAGASWELLGTVEGEPWKLLAIDSEHLFIALADGAIIESTDGGRSWQEYFSP